MRCMIDIVWLKGSKKKTYLLSLYLCVYSHQIGINGRFPKKTGAEPNVAARSYIHWVMSHNAK